MPAFLYLLYLKKLTMTADLKTLYNAPDVADPADVVIGNPYEVVNNIASEMRRLKSHLGCQLLGLLFVTGVWLMNIIRGLTNVFQRSATAPDSSAPPVSPHLFDILGNGCAVLIVVSMLLLLFGLLLTTIRQYFFDSPERVYARLLKSGSITQAKVTGVKRLEKNELLEFTYTYQVVRNIPYTGIYQTDVETDIRYGDQVKILYTGDISIIL